MNGADGAHRPRAPAFLGAGRYTATMARDDTANAAAMKVETATISSGDALTSPSAPAAASSRGSPRGLTPAAGRSWEIGV